MWGVAELRDWTMSEFTEHPRPAGRVLTRIEQLEEYGVASDGSDYQRHRDGEPEPDPARMDPWLNRVSREAECGLERHQVHVVRTPLHPYLRFECEWAYVHNVAAGARVGILDLAEQTLTPAELDILRSAGEVWVREARDEPPQAVVMHYGDGGAFLGAEPAANPYPYVVAAELARRLAVPFTSWWAAHPGEHRENRAAA